MSGAVDRVLREAIESQAVVIKKLRQQLEISERHTMEAAREAETARQDVIRLTAQLEQATADLTSARDRVGAVARTMTP